MKEGSGLVSRAAARSSATEEGGGGGGEEGGGEPPPLTCAAASFGRSLAVSHIDALETTAVVARTRTDAGDEEEEEEGEEEEEATTRTPLALPPSTTISSTLEFRATRPPNFSIPRTRASTMALDPPIG